MRSFGYVASLLLGLATGTAAVAVHRLPAGLLLGVGATLAVMWALHEWLARASAAFALGWLVAILAALAGRGEGDHVVASDGRGFVLIGAGIVVVVAGMGSTVPPRRWHDSGSSGGPT